MIVGEFNTPWSPIVSLSIATTTKNINKEISELNDTIDQVDLIDIYRVYHPAIAQMHIFSQQPIL
jgi:hypothetical protein